MSKKPTYEELEQRVKEFEKEVEKRKQAEEALQQKTHDLGERVKELDCLYSISNLVEQLDISLDEIFQGVVDIIPPSWQYPEVTCSRINLNGKEYKTENFKETNWKQTSDIFVFGEQKGILEIYYLEEKPEIDEGPFLKEERSLINDITERLGRIIERKQAEEALRESEQNLKIKTEDLETLNTALKVLLDKRQEDKIEIEEKILSNVRTLIEPYLAKLIELNLPQRQKRLLDILESNLNEIISPFTQRLSSKYINLSPTEIKVANLVKQEKTNKEIAEIQEVTSCAIAFHRGNIRKKLGLKNKKVNLKTYLMSLPLD